jgi:hypothetical protein
MTTGMPTTWQSRSPGRHDHSRRAWEFYAVRLAVARRLLASLPAVVLQRGGHGLGQLHDARTRHEDAGLTEKKSIAKTSRAWTISRRITVVGMAKRQ